MIERHFVQRAGFHRLDRARAVRILLAHPAARIVVITEADRAEAVGRAIIFDFHRGVGDPAGERAGKARQRRRDDLVAAPLERSIVDIEQRFIVARDIDPALRHRLPGNERTEREGGEHEQLHRESLPVSCRTMTQDRDGSKRPGFTRTGRTCRIGVR
jgi:hypothetical protein